MKPYAGEIEAWEVGAEVGNVKNNRPELMERVGLLRCGVWSGFTQARSGSLIGHQCHDLVVASDRLGDLDLLGASVQRYAQNC